MTTAGDLTFRTIPTTCVERGPDKEPCVKATVSPSTLMSNRNAKRRRMWRPCRALLALCILVLSALANAADGLPNAQDTLHRTANTQADQKTRTYDSLGRAYLQQELLDSAMVNFLNALSAAEEIGAKQAIAVSYINIANVLIAQNDRSRAMVYLQQALAVHREQADPVNMGACYNNIAAVYLGSDSLLLARSYLDSASAIYAATGKLQGVAACEQNLGIVEGNLGDHNKAFMHFSRALELNQGLGDAYRMAISLSNIAFTHVNLRQYRDALASGSRGIALCDSLGISDTKLDLLGILVAASDSLGDVQQAYHYLKLQKALADSLGQQEQQQRILDLERRYDSERKAAEITGLQKDLRLQDSWLERNRTTTRYLTITALLVLLLLVIYWRLYRVRTISARVITEKNSALERANADLRKTTEQLQASLATKNRFFTVLAHDLKGPIGTYRSVSRGLEDSISELTRQQVQEQVHFLSRSASHVHELLENLLLWATSQTGNLIFTPREVDMDVLVHRSISLAEDSAARKRITITVNSDPDAYAYSDQNMVMVVLNNLLSNAVRFSLPDGRIDVRVSVQHPVIRVAVTDFGIGIEAHDLPKLFDIGMDRKTIGSSLEKGSGIGLILCQEFVERNNGRIGVESAPSQGSTFWFTLPASPIFEVQPNGQGS